MDSIPGILTPEEIKIQELEKKNKALLTTLRRCFLAMKSGRLLIAEHRRDVMDNAIREAEKVLEQGRAAAK